MGPLCIKESIDYLRTLNHPREGGFYELSRMEQLLVALGSPEKGLRAIHIAGTNGKGSTAAHLEAIYRAAGYQTGLYTSPHLISLRERIQIDRVPLSSEALAEGVASIRTALSSIAAEEKPTFFETMTALAFLHFAREAVDIAIIETGMGGRLDATNVLPSPLATVITTISFDHEAILGDTLAAIAFEKAGILKPGVPAFVGKLPVEAEAMIAQVAQEKGAPLMRLCDRYEARQVDYPTTALEGVHQRHNAGLAVMTVESLQEAFPVDAAALFQGLATVEWAGRWQEVPLEKGPQVILDVAHNEEAAGVLAQQLKDWVAARGSKPAILLGTTSLARARVVIKSMAPYAASFLLAQSEQPRSIELEVLLSCIPLDFLGTVHTVNLKDVFPEPGICAFKGMEDTLLVTGSVYLVGEVLSLLKYGHTGETDLQDRF